MIIFHTSRQNKNNINILLLTKIKIAFKTRLISKIFEMLPNLNFLYDEIVFKYSPKIYGSKREFEKKKKIYICIYTYIY